MIPLLLEAAPRTALWGGNRLHDRYRKPDLPHLAETWELSARGERPCLIINEPFAGMPFDRYLTEIEHSNLPFPLLIKFIDAAQPLSVQVHPDDACAAMFGESGKTELWHIIEAEPGARLILGLRDGVDRGTFAAALQRGDPTPLLREVEVHAGESYFIPAGLLHAIGTPSHAGILLAEIQQNSDSTYRTWDYGRMDTNGAQRQLHTAEANRALHLYTPEEVEALRFSRRDRCTLAGECICACDQFSVSLFRGERGFKVEESFLSLLCLRGEGILSASGTELTFSAGQSIYLPPHIGICQLHGNAEFLLSAPS
ncbi:MAG: class I mannose-6-phosphate isomerase [Clostridia bacterium]|nr:class I mannose-6-phosphate isomerase [Clostridia bacterium]